MNSASTPPEFPDRTAYRRSTSSGWVTPAIIGVVCLGLLVAALEHGRGNFHRLQTAVGSQATPPPLPTGPGGQDPLRLTRSASSIGAGPEFLSVTMLPGRGMNMLELTASVPGHGEVPLLMSPSLAEANRVLNGTGEDANGGRSTTFGGALLLPWAGQLTGTASSVPGMLQTTWNGERLSFPEAGNSGRSVEGLMLKRPSDGVETSIVTDGQIAQAVFHSKDGPNGERDWPNSLDVTVRVELSSHTLDLTMTAKNVGHTAVPVGAGWHPFFIVPSGDRANALLTLPSTTIAEVNRKTGLPTGKTTSVQSTPLNYIHAEGTRLGSSSINETFVDLQTGAVADGPIAQLRDPAFNVGLRIIPMTANIRNLRVIAPSDKPWISIGPNTNLDDPFGAEWARPEDSGMVTLEVGATFEWKVRLELSALTVTENPL